MLRDLSVQPARQEELAPAFRLLFQYVPDEERAAHVARVLTLVDQGELPASGVLVGRRGQAVCGALIQQQLPGACGLLWPPQAIGEQQEAIEDALLRYAVGQLRSQGSKLIQGLLPPGKDPLAAPLLRNGFAHVTTLLYLHHTLGAEWAEQPSRLTFHPYSQDDAALFSETLMRTYESTFDCPELNGVRTPDEVLAGHLAVSRGEPRRWWLATTAAQPVGVLLLAAAPEWNALDISYVGVVPEARGAGLGKELLCQALREALAAQVGRVTLAVDIRNQPARHLYARLGFVEFDQREVYLAFFPSA